MLRAAHTGAAHLGGRGNESRLRGFNVSILEADPKGPLGLSWHFSQTIRVS